MTAIVSFFIDREQKLVVISDRQVTYEETPNEWLEKDKFFIKSGFYIFCAGSEDIYKQIIGEITTVYQNINDLAEFIKEKFVDIKNSRMRIGIRNDRCDFIIVDPRNFWAVSVKRATISDLEKYEIIGRLLADQAALRRTREEKDE